MIEVFYGVTWRVDKWVTWETHLIRAGGRYNVAPSDPDPYLRKFRSHSVSEVESSFDKTREGAIEKWRAAKRKRAADLQRQADELLKLALLEKFE